MERLGLSQAELARLLDVSPRSVTRWATEGGEEVPGPVQAYLRMLQMAPSTLRNAEIGRARKPPFQEGIYQLTFEGVQGFGVGTLVFTAGRVWGADTGGLQYDGNYVLDDTSRTVAMQVKLSAPQGGQLVTGVTLAPGATFEISARVPYFSNEVTTPVQTPYGAVVARLTFLRSTT